MPDSIIPEEARPETGSSGPASGLPGPVDGFRTADPESASPDEERVSEPVSAIADVGVAASPPSVEAHHATVSVDALTRVQYAMHANGVCMLREVCIENHGEKVLRDLRVVVSAEPAFAKPLEVRVDELRPDQVRRLEQPNLRLDHGFLDRLTERVSGSLLIELWCADARLATAEHNLIVFARNEWPGDSVYPELLAAFVLPNEPAVSRVLSRAGDLLERWTGSPSLDGYQRRDPEVALQQAAAIYGALRGEGIQYINPPASFEEEGQRVRLPEQILEQRQATCLDLALLAAAAMEQAGLHPVVGLVDGHALCGVWLDEQSFPNAITDDPARVRNHLSNRDLVVFDPTTAVAGVASDFEESQAVGRRHLLDDSKFRFIVDIHRARRGQVRPMPTESTASSIQGESRGSDLDLSAPESADVLAARDRRQRLVREVEQGPKRIETWKRKLLDLTLRNRLLNVPAKARIVRLLVPDVAGVEDALADGSRFKIRHRPDEVTHGVAEAESRHLTEADLRPLLLEEQARGVLYADMDEEALEKRLTALLREAKTAEEEGGSSNLYLSLGLLRFFETEKSEKARLAPVVLVPVTLKRKTVSEGIVLEARAEDARINVTLLRYLEETHGVRVEGVDPPPDDGNGLDIPFIFQRFREEIIPKRGWEIVEEAQVGMLSFSKILIWRDLDEYAMRLLESPLVRHLVETPGEDFRDGVEFQKPSEMDRVARSTETYVPMSADSSQLSAILAAAAGKSFVLIGPPGTGKSQTITNLITHCLATGRTVLFVSEKMAALEVVHRRLVSVGIGDRCLELHSDKAKKRQVLGQLAASLDADEEVSSVDRDGIARDLDQVRERLNGYVDALHRERWSGETVFQVLSRLIGLADAPKVELGWAQVDRTSADKLAGARKVLKDAQVAAEAAAVGPRHSLSEIGQTKYTPLWERDAKGAIGEAVDALRGLEEPARVVRDAVLAGGDWPAWGERAPLLRAVSLWSRPVAVSPEALTEADSGGVEREVEAAIAEVEWLGSERAHFEQRYARHRDEIDVDALLGELRSIDASWFLPRFFGRRRWTKRFAGVATPKAPVGTEAAAADLQRLDGLRERERTFPERTALARRFLGELWDGDRSDVKTLREALEWLRQLRGTAREIAGGDSERAADLLRAWVRLLPGQAGIDPSLGEALATIEGSWAAAAHAARTVDQQLRLVDARTWFGADPSTCLPQAERWLAGWEGIKAWCRWRAERERALAAELDALVLALERGTLAAGQLRNGFERSYGEEWYLHTISADDTLADFESEDHERGIARFRQLDDELLAATKASVRARIDSLGRSKANLRNGVQGAFLRREIQKQLRHKPIRTIFKEAGDLVRELRPCLLMSPLSVAQYLVPSLPRFDVVVFDEASQMPPWDAIGAVARGNQLIVVGDPKQLPPTNFFGRTDSGTDEEGETEDLESVLDECIASNIDQHTLAWHYRSRHESLIAFSNRNYYDGKLITFPSAVDHGLGVSWRPVPDGVYDFGKSRTNRGEAEAVVAEIVRRLKDPALHRFSLGVVALSQAQQMLVLDLLDNARRNDPEIERFFGDGVQEPVFVKNLENVQGDERDVILFTVCYGPDLNGRVRMNFGPLNKEGGWRRLNVAITRAKREVLVFSTLTHDQIDLNKSNSTGVRDLKRFLQFAEQGEEAFRRELATNITAEFDSPFEAEVAAVLEGRGWTVHRQVGCSGYRIDLALVDPEHPGRYLLGIECDGASYHSAPSARDRDKLRHDLLEGLGWRLHRIWSTDWWQDREREIADLLAAIDDASARQEPEPLAGSEVRETAVGSSQRESSVPPESPSTGAETTPEHAALTPPRGRTEVSGPKLSGLGEPVLRKSTGTERVSLPTTSAERVQAVLSAIRADPAGHPHVGDLGPYRATPLVPRGGQDDFYSDAATPSIVGALCDVVQSEAPIIESVAVRRVGESWGFMRMKAKAVARVTRCIGMTGLHVTQERGERVLWPSSADASSHRGARLPIGDDERDHRAIGDVPLVEIAELLRFWVDQAGPMSERELLEHATRSLGFRSLGSTIRHRLEAGQKVAVERGVLDIAGATVRRPSA